MVYNKLVRDLIPATIQENGKTPKTRVLSDDAEFLKQLNHKLVEEVQEYLAVEEDIDVLEELADIAEVMQAILAAKKLSGLQLEVLRRQKAEKRGTFSQRIFLQEVIGEENVKKAEPKNSNTKPKEEKLGEMLPGEGKPGEPKQDPVL